MWLSFPARSICRAICSCILAFTCNSVAAQPIADAAPAGLALPRSTTAPLDAQPAYVAIRINQQPVSDNALILRSGKDAMQFFLNAKDASNFRLTLARHFSPFNFEQESFFPLQGIAGLALAFDDITQTLSITATPQLFESESIDMGAAASAIAARPAFGTFLSYDLTTQGNTLGSQSASSGGQFEWGVFTPRGVFTNTMFATKSATDRKFVRLDSTFTIDNPETLASWRIGDGITRSAPWGTPARFSGIQYATNFGTQPTLVTYPLNSISGQTSFPSVVDVYINNIFTATKPIQPGAFTLNELPAINGQGEIRLLVRDVLGREQTIVKSLYGSTALLKAGLNDFAIQAGTFRESYALRSFAYGQGFVSAFWRRGMTDKLTLEGAIEAARGRYALGAGANWLLGALGEFSASIAASERPAPVIETTPPLVLVLDQSVTSLGNTTSRRGKSVAFAWNRRAIGVNFGVQGKISSAGFRSVTGFPSGAPSRREISASASYPSSLGSVALGYAAVTRATEDGSEAHQEALQFTWSKGFGNWGLLSFNGGLNLRGGRNRSLSLGYSLPLDLASIIGISASMVESNQGRQTDVRLNMQQNVPTGDGYGYRIDISDQNRASLNVQAQNRVGVYSGELARVRGVTSARIGVSGSLIYLGGEVSLGRRAEDAFALVTVPGFEGVRVYLDNQVVGKTNTEGNLFVSRLRPYQVNRLSIEQLDLPISAEVLSLKLDATPFLKSGVIVRFAVKESLGGIARFVDAEGLPIPAGAVVTITSTNDGAAGFRPQLDVTSFPMAENGEAFLTGLLARNRARVDWQGKRCTIDFNYLRNDDPQPLLGVFTCKLEK